MVGSNPCNTDLELKLFLCETRTKFVIVEPDLLDSILPAALESGIHQENIFLLNTQTNVTRKGFDSWKSLLRYGTSDWKHFDDEKIARSTIAALLYTSGSSGTPKAAAVSHYALIARTLSMLDDTSKRYEVSIHLLRELRNSKLLRTV